jgi:flagellar biosynthesis anti-sigma factor FlgM
MDVTDRSNYTSSLESLGLESTALASTRVDAGKASTSTVAGSAAGKDSSHLSSAAEAIAQTMQMPEVRQDRVTSLQQQIAGGNYHVDAQNVADAMLRNFAG